MEFDWHPDLSEAADSVGGQLRGDKDSARIGYAIEEVFSGVTNSGRVWRKVSESGAGEWVAEAPSEELMLLSCGLYARGFPTC